MRPKITKAKLRKAAVAVLFVISIILTAYTVSAHYVAGSIVEIDGQLMWGTATRGSLLPLPRLPGDLGTTISVLEADTLIYTYLIRTGVLVTITLLLWTVTIWTIWKLRRPRRKVKGPR